MSLFRSLLIESSKAATEEMMDRVKSAVGFPCIVKPNRGAACTGIMFNCGVELKLWSVELS